MRTLKLSNIFYALFIYCSLTSDAHAYLDPGTGSLLFSAILGLVSTIYFWGKSLIHKSIHLYSVVTGKKVDINDRGADIVFYSEGAQYWNTFKPVIEALSKLDVPVTYWTSDKSDPALAHDLSTMTAKFIGKGNKAYSRLNMMHAKVCVSTTPGLDVLQIKRSKGVEHYIHLVHAPTTGTYKLYSFDYFDSVMCSGQHQIDAIRELETKRGSKAKKLWETGCTYMDVLADQIDNKTHPTDKKSPTKTVLVAPSWGENGLLTRFGESLVIELLNSGFNVILRPHPNSQIVEKDLLANLKNSLEKYEHLIWDHNPSGFDSLNKADVLISDFSGIVFDFAFAFEKPVITAEFKVQLNGLDANDLANGLWELSVLDLLGKRVCHNDMAKLPNIVNSLLESNSYKGQDLRNMRDKSIFNYGNAGNIAANQILTILNNNKLFDTKADNPSL